MIFFCNPFRDWGLHVHRMFFLVMIYVKGYIQFTVSHAQDPVHRRLITQIKKILPFKV